MVNLIMSQLNGNAAQEILGIILSVFEVFIVVGKLITFFFPEDTKVGKFIRTYILPGLKSAKKYLSTDAKSDLGIPDDKEDDKHEDQR
jgi:hypothetical protein